MLPLVEWSLPRPDISLKEFLKKIILSRRLSPQIPKVGWQTDWWHQSVLGSLPKFLIVELIHKAIWGLNAFQIRLGLGVTDLIGRNPPENCYFFKKWPNPPSFITYFRSFQANIITIFTTNICELMSIQYMDSGIQTHDLRVSSHNQLDQGSSWRMFVKKPTPTLMAFTVPSPQPTACRSPKCSLMTATGSNQARPKARFKPNSLKKSGVDGGSIRCPRWRLLLLYIFLKKMGQSWPLFPFIFVFSTRYNSNSIF